MSSLRSDRLQPISVGTGAGIGSLLIASCLLFLSTDSAFAQDSSNNRPNHDIVYSCPNLPQQSKISFLDVRMYQGYDGWFFRSVDFESDFTLPPSTLDFYTRLNKALLERETQLVVVALPPRSLTAIGKVPPDIATITNFQPAVMRRSFADFLGALRRSGAIVVDTEQLLDAPDVENFYFSRDLHWRPSGALATAKAVRLGLEKDPAFVDLPRKAFTNQVTNPEVPLLTAIQKALLSMCKEPIPREYRAVYETVAPEASVDDFLSDAEQVPVAVVGTSFSDEVKQFNFVGFLREQLQMEVASYAISGGDLDQSIYQFLHSDAVSEEKPHYLLWELPFVGRMEEISDNLIRQLVPAAEGVCDGTTVIAETPYELTEPGRVTIEAPVEAKLSGNKYYVAMTLSDPSIRNFVAFLRYDDGEEEIFTVSRPSRVPATDKLFIELSNEFTGSLTEVEVETLDGTSVSGTVKLCRAGPTRNAAAASN